MYEVSRFIMYSELNPLALDSKLEEERNWKFLVLVFGKVLLTHQNPLRRDNLSILWLFVELRVPSQALWVITNLRMELSEHMNMLYNDSVDGKMSQLYTFAANPDEIRFRRHTRRYALNIHQPGHRKVRKGSKSFLSASCDGVPLNPQWYIFIF